MSSAISGSLNLARAQTRIPLDKDGNPSNVQNFSTFDAIELIGHVDVKGTSLYRASVKLSIVKNGAGVYEVAASDIAGDDYLGSPIVSFSFSGSMLQATIDAGLVAAETLVQADTFIKFNLSAPAIGGTELAIDADNIVTGTIDSGVLPAGQYPGADGSSAIPAGYVGEKIFGGSNSITFTTTNGSFAYTDIAAPNGVWMATFRAYKSVSSTTTAMSVAVTPRSVTTSGDIQSSGYTYNLGSAKISANMFTGAGCDTVVVSDGYIRVWASQYGTSLTGTSGFFIFSLTRIA